LYISFLSALSRKTDTAPHHTITRWVVDEEFYNQQTGLLIPSGEYLLKNTVNISVYHVHW